MQIKSTIPSAQLNHLIREFSFISIDPSEMSINDQIVIDDGCYDFVFFNGKEINFRSGNNCEIKIENGAFTIHQLPPPCKQIFNQGIQLFVAKVQPWANAHFFPATMEPGLVDLNSIFPEVIAQTHDDIFQTNSFEKKISIVESFIANLAIKEEESFHTIRNICNKIYEMNGAIKVNDLVDIFKINRQLLNKIFKHQVHYTIKQFIKIVRIMSFIKFKIANQVVSLSSAAYHFDYTDQAHFNNDFKKVCGISPSAFFKDLPVFFQRHKKLI